MHTAEGNVTIVYEEPFLPISEFTPTNFIDMPLMAEAACLEDLEDELLLNQPVDDPFAQLFEDENEA